MQCYRAAFATNITCPHEEQSGPDFRRVQCRQLGQPSPSEERGQPANRQFVLLLGSPVQTHLHYLEVPAFDYLFGDLAIIANIRSFQVRQYRTLRH
ncbi:hypothetical protein ES703_93042 [subsurface metagenome]